MSEISGLGPYNSPLNSPEPSGQAVNVFGRNLQLYAQASGDDHSWTAEQHKKVTRILQGTAYVDAGGKLNKAGEDTVNARITGLGERHIALSPDEVAYGILAEQSPNESISALRIKQSGVMYKKAIRLTLFQDLDTFSRRDGFDQLHSLQRYQKIQERYGLGEDNTLSVLDAVAGHKELREKLFPISANAFIRDLGSGASGNNLTWLVMSVFFDFFHEPHLLEGNADSSTDLTNIRSVTTVNMYPQLISDLGNVSQAGNLYTYELLRRGIKHISDDGLAVINQFIRGEELPTPEVFAKWLNNFKQQGLTHSASGQADMESLEILYQQAVTLQSGNILQEAQASQLIEEMRDVLQAIYERNFPDITAVELKQQYLTGQAIRHLTGTNEQHREAVTAFQQSGTFATLKTIARKLWDWADRTPMPAYKAVKAMYDQLESQYPESLFENAAEAANLSFAYLRGDIDAAGFIEGVYQQLAKTSQHLYFLQPEYIYAAYGDGAFTNPQFIGMLQSVMLDQLKNSQRAAAGQLANNVAINSVSSQQQAPPEAEQRLQNLQQQIYQQTGAEQWLSVTGELEGTPYLTGNKLNEKGRQAIALQAAKLKIQFPEFELPLRFAATAAYVEYHNQYTGEQRSTIELDRVLAVSQPYSRQLARLQELQGLLQQLGMTVQELVNASQGEVTITQQAGAEAETQVYSIQQYMAALLADTNYPAAELINLAKEQPALKKNEQAAAGKQSSRVAMIAAFTNTHLEQVVQWEAQLKPTGLTLNSILQTVESLSVDAVDKAVAVEVKAYQDKQEEISKQVQKFLHSDDVPAEIKDRWQQVLAVNNTESMTFLVNHIQRGRELTLNAVGKAIGPLPAVKPLQIDQPVKLVPGEQYAIVNTDPVNTVNQLLLSMQISGNSPAFHIRLETADGRDAVNPVNENNSKKSATFQVYWHGDDPDLGTQYFTSAGGILQMQASSYERVVPVLQTNQGGMSLNEFLQLKQENGRPLVARLIVSNAETVIRNRGGMLMEDSKGRESTLYNLPTEVQISELVQALDAANIQTVDKLYMFLTGDEAGKRATAAMMRAEPVAIRIWSLYNDRFQSASTVDELNKQKQKVNKVLSQINPATQKQGLAELKQQAYNDRLRQLVTNGAVLEGARLAMADLSDLDLSGMRLQGLSAINSIFAGAKLQDTLLTDSILLDVDFTRTDLRNAKLIRADLKGSRLNGADMTGADLSGANLEYLDLRETVLTGVQYDDKTSWDGALLTDAQRQALGLDAERLLTPYGPLNQVVWGDTLQTSGSDTPLPTQPAAATTSNGLMDLWKLRNLQSAAAETPSDRADTQYPGLRHAITEYTLGHLPLAMHGYGPEMWTGHGAIEDAGGYEWFLGPPEPDAGYTLSMMSAAKLNMKMSGNTALTDKGFKPEDFGTEILALKYLGLHDSLPVYIVALNRNADSAFRNLPEEIRADANFTAEDVKFIRGRIQDLVTGFLNAGLGVSPRNYTENARLIIARDQQGRVSEVKLSNPSITDLSLSGKEKAAAAINTLAEIEVGEYFSDLNAQEWQYLKEQRNFTKANFIETVNNLVKNLGLESSKVQVSQKIAVLNFIYLSINSFPESLAEMLKTLVQIGVKASGLTAEDLRSGLQPGVFEHLGLAEVFNEEAGQQSSSGSDASRAADNSGQTTDSLAPPATEKAEQANQSSDNPVVKQFGTNNEDSTISTQLPGGSSGPNNQPAYTRFNINRLQQDENQPGGFSAKPSVAPLPANLAESFQQKNTPGAEQAALKADLYQKLPAAVQQHISLDEFQGLDISAVDLPHIYIEYMNLHADVRGTDQSPQFKLIDYIAYPKAMRDTLLVNSASAKHTDAKVAAYNAQAKIYQQQAAEITKITAQIQKQTAQLAQSTRAIQQQNSVTAEWINLQQNRRPAQIPGDVTGTVTAVKNNIQSSSPNTYSINAGTRVSSEPTPAGYISLNGRSGPVMSLYPNAYNMPPYVYQKDSQGHMALHVVVNTTGQGLSLQKVSPDLIKAPANAQATTHQQNQWHNVPKLSYSQHQTLSALYKIPQPQLDSINPLNNKTGSSSQPAPLSPVIPAPVNSSAPAPVTTPVNVPVLP